jgi:hypothetical protein
MVGGAASVAFRNKIFSDSCFAFERSFSVLERVLGPFCVCLGRVEIGARLLHLCLESRRIDLGNDLPLFYRRVEVYVEALEYSRNLGADQNILYGIYRSGRRYGCGNSAPHHRFGSIFRIIAVAGQGIYQHNGEDNQCPCCHD